jgi:phospholipid/cholesterol/gamma-HCH transport system substrate-binding protein
VSRSVLGRLIALVIVTVVGVYYIAFDAVGVHVVDQPYHIKVVMPQAGGLYQDAYVTYRGVEVGKVSSLQLHPTEVVATLAIKHGTRIPANVSASVRELTAAAEQYMDLVPAGPDPPSSFLQPGDTIPENRTSIPVPVGTLLNTVNSLVNSLSAQDLNTLSSALATGLGNAGGDLHAIIVDGNTLVNALQSAIPGTSELINAGNTVLSTFDQTSNDFAQFSANLNSLTAQVKASNDALVGLLQNGATAGQALTGFLNQFANPTVGLIDELAQSTDVAFQRQDAVRALFQVLPLFASDVAETVSGGQVHFSIDFNTADPVCSYTPMVPLPEPTKLVDSTASLDRTCPTVAPNLLQRGADKAPPPHT